MRNILLIRYGEIHLKGLNRPYFERIQMDRIKDALHSIGGTDVYKGTGRIYVKGIPENGMQKAKNALRKVFGLHSLSPAVEIEDKSPESVFRAAVQCVKGFMADKGKEALTFKVEARRSDKQYPLNSMHIAREAGAYILQHVDGLSVDVHHPELTVYIEIREKAYVYTEIIKAPGGMPVGSNGKAMLLLSGGIDSPVAAYMIAKRGIEVSAVHFHSFPYTSEKAKQKVIELARLLSAYVGPVALYIVGFTEMQRAIYENCPEAEITVLMRRSMMKIAEQLAEKTGAQALITGESLGQVASQTIESLHVTDVSVGLPVFRPLIGLDKIEIMDLARKIGTYETSILPYEDCCTVFVPKHPVTKPKLDKILCSERLFDFKPLMDSAAGTAEKIIVK